MSGSRKFSILYEKYNKLFYYIMNGVLKNHEDTEDAMQIWCTRLFKAMRNMTDEEIDHTYNKSMLWLSAKNAAIDYNRRRESRARAVSRYEAEYDLNMPKSAKSAEAQYFEMEQYKELVKLIGTLTEKEREILIFKFVYHLSAKEIASICDMKPASVDSTVYRAKNKLLAKLEAQKNRDRLEGL